MEFLNTLFSVKKNYKEYLQWDKKWDDKEAQRQVLSSQMDIPKDRLEKADALGKTIIRTIEVMDENSEENTESAELATAPILLGGALGGMAPGFIYIFKQLEKNPKKALKIGLPLSVVGPIVGTVAGILTGTYFQKLASRISHYQSNQDLKDSKNFVVYDKEQLEQAKEIAKNMPDKKEKKFLGLFGKSDKTHKGFFKRIGCLFKDYDKYKEWKKNQNDDISTTAINSTPEQLKKAKADQDVLFRSVKKINESAEEYSENMETSAGVLMQTSFIGGAALGVISGGILKAVGAAKRMRKFIVKKVDKKFPGLGMPINWVLRRKLVVGGMFAAMGSVLTSIIVTPTIMKLQLHAAKVGRFVAKRELEKDPKNFIHYEDKQLESVKTVKSAKEKGFWNRIKDDLMFIPKALKETKKYNEYKEKHEKDHKKVKEALKQVELKPGQIEEAKNLQHKVFKTFNKVDEMSQVYSEDMESFSQMIQAAIPQIKQLMFYTPIAAGGFMIYSGIKKGKITPATALEKGSTVVSKITGLLKGKNIKNYFMEVDELINAQKSSNKYSSVTQSLREVVTNPNTDSIINAGKTIMTSVKESIGTKTSSLDAEKIVKIGKSARALASVGILPKELKPVLEHGVPVLERIVPNINKFKAGKINMNELIDSSIESLSKSESASGSVKKLQETLKKIPDDKVKEIFDNLTGSNLLPKELKQLNPVELKNTIIKSKNVFAEPLVKNIVSSTIESATKLNPEKFLQAAKKEFMSIMKLDEAAIESLSKNKATTEFIQKTLKNNIDAIDEKAISEGISKITQSGLLPKEMQESLSKINVPEVKKALMESDNFLAEPVVKQSIASVREVISNLTPKKAFKVAQEALKKMPEEDFVKVIDSYKKTMSQVEGVPAEVAKKIAGINSKKLIQELKNTSSLEEAPYVKETIATLGNSGVKSGIKMLKEMEVVPAEIMQKFESVDSQKLIQELMNAKNIEEAPYALKSLKSVGDGYINWGLKKLKEKAAKMDTSELRTKAKTFLTNLRENIEKTDNPKEIAKKLAFLPGEMGEHVAKMPKKKILKTIDNWQKMADNVPADELNKVLTTMKENPEKVFDMVAKGKVLSTIGAPLIMPISIFTAVTLGTYNLGCFAATWLLQSSLAEMEKQAGRVGTMKALQYLDDPRHFVDKYPSSENSSLVSNNIKSAENKKLALNTKPVQTNTLVTENKPLKNKTLVSNIKPDNKPVAQSLAVTAGNSMIDSWRKKYRTAA